MAETVKDREPDAVTIAETTNARRRFTELVKLKGLGYALLQAIDFVLKEGLSKPLRTYLEYLRFLAKSPKQWQKRVEILRRYRAIHRAMHCGPSESELLHIADEILLIPDSLEGDIIECGVYKGGSTCKLSIAAKLTKRKLVACDSFSGLPVPGEDEKMHFEQGQYLAALNEVHDSITRFGELNSVEIVPGWFHETLPRLRDRKFIAIFEDADLYESVLCCVKNLWPALQPGCKMFTHEVPYPPALKAYTDQAFWLHEFGHSPPPLVRVGVGRRLRTFNLGYIQKPRATKEDFSSRVGV